MNLFPFLTRRRKVKRRVKRKTAKQGNKNTVMTIKDHEIKGW